MGEMKCLTPWDYQGKRLYMKDGIYPTLYAASDSGQQTHGICYAIEGNIVDRVSAKNGKGWCENVSPTLNTQDRHAVVYDWSSVTSPKNWNNPKPGDPCYALHTDSRNYVVISMEGNGARPSHMGKGFSNDGTMYTLHTIEQHSVCYSVDCRNLKTNTELSGTLQTKETGGWSLNYLNPVVYENEK